MELRLKFELSLKLALAPPDVCGALLEREQSSLM